MGKIQKMFIHLWKEISLGMSIMLSLMFVWNLGLIYKIYSDIKADLGSQVGDVLLLTFIYFIIFYIIILSAKIISYF